MKNLRGFVNNVLHGVHQPPGSPERPSRLKPREQAQLLAVRRTLHETHWDRGEREETTAP